jgi:hypothetical protein
MAAVSVARKKHKRKRRVNEVIEWIENINQEEANNSHRIGFPAKARRTSGKHAMEVENSQKMRYHRNRRGGESRE